MVTDPTPGLFFAYPATPRLAAETMRLAIERLRKSGVPAVGWEQLGVDGHWLIDMICDSIKNSSAVVAEISNLNNNVLFEAGYAIACNKVVWLALDETDVVATKNWSNLSLLSTVGRTNYSGNADVLVRKIAGDRPDEQAAVLFDALLAGGAPRDGSTIFAPSVPTKFNAAIALERMLERNGGWTVRGGSDDLGIAPLDFYVKEIYRSSAAIFHLLGEHRLRASEHNARASFLAGIAAGLELPILMVVEDGYVSPLDYKDKLFAYPTSAALQAHVTQWLSGLSKTGASGKRAGRLALDIELPIRSFGQYVAEYEAQELSDYFIETSEYQSILAGTARVFIGRKGTGKTATMSQAVAELREDRRNLVVPIKPSAYELTGLIEAVARFKSDSSSQYFILTLWSYLITTEVARRIVSHGRDLPAGLPEGTPQRAVETELELWGIADDDLATRLEGAASAILEGEMEAGETEQQFISRRLRTERIGRLQKLVVEATRNYERVAVLIDNLDKAWERGADYATMSRFILGLLSTSGRLEKEFARLVAGGRGARFSLGVFLRTDIFDVISSSAREPDKIGALSVHWRDEELLARVLEERYAAKRSGCDVIPGQMWAELFAPEVRGLPTRDYLLWRTLSRPRDLIYLANAALTTAINRRHSVVQEGDVLLGESLYSKFATEALLVESEAQGFDVEEVLFEFAGLTSTIDHELLQGILAPSGREAEVTEWLVRTSFLGVEVEDGSFMHVEGATEARRKLRAAGRLAARLDRPLRYRVHPAFRHNLDVRDDDIHSGDIHDVTLA